MTSIFQKLTRPFTSSTLRFAPAGCFWGVEHMYRKDFGNKGLLDARVGYIGGDTKSPGYRAVCSGTTGRE
jgi:peptide-methionine (S)-S-oxide reductase